MVTLHNTLIRFSPTDFMRARRPELYSDTMYKEELILDRNQFEFHLDTLTQRKEEIRFEHFCRRLAEKELCPNLLPQTGPTGGGDSNVDAETFPVAETIAERCTLWPPIGPYKYANPKSKQAKSKFYGKISAKLPQAIQRTAAIKLKMLNAVSLLETLRVPPSYYLETLHFDREVQHSIRINKQWRICFIWQGNDAYNVEIVDYH